MKFAALLACALLMACAGTDAKTKGRRDGASGGAAAATSATAANAATEANPGTAAAKASRAADRSAGSAADTAAYGRRDDVLAFAADVAQRRGWEREWVESQLASARQLPSVQRLVMPPPTGTAKNWAAYRARFIEPRRIEAGAQFWRMHEAALARAEAEYGVPAAIIAGVIGVETYYGRFMGTYRTVDALATLAFDFPAGRRDRSAYFRSELEQLLVLARRDGLPLDQVTGSYAGAIGLPQFMPGSVNTYAIDYDGDGRVDLRDSPADAIGSVANYLASFGWRRGMPTHYAVQPPDDAANLGVLLAPDIVPMFSAGEFAQMGAMLPDEGARAHEGPLALVALDNGDGAPRSYVAGTENFYVITRYNWSSYYALAVIELGSAVSAAVSR